jgi:hypothetical protein
MGIIAELRLRKFACSVRPGVSELVAPHYRKVHFDPAFRRSLTTANDGCYMPFFVAIER